MRQFSARRWSAFAAIVAALLLTVNLVALLGLWGTLDRGPTAAELRRAADAEVARRWSAWPAGRIFPDRLAYSIVGQSEYAGRVGIGGGLDCADAVDPALGSALARSGCLAVLRATYLDQLQGVVVTIGVAVFPHEQAAYRARLTLPSGHLRALPIAGTPTDRFTDAARQYGTVERAGPYLVLTTAGQTDGRPASSVRVPRIGVFDAVAQLGHTVGQTLSQRALPNCRSREWQC